MKLRKPWCWVKRLVAAALYLGRKGEPPKPEIPVRRLVEKYFEEHSDAKDEVVKAYFAYHAHHIRDNPGAHNFAGPWRDCECRWCGRSRELVRWDDLPAQCQKRPELPNIVEVLGREVAMFEALLEKAKTHVPKIIAKLGMSGETLAVLHHTHGYDPETVDGVVPVPPQIMVDYHAAMETERERSRTAIVREVIAVRAA
jgi:hypothetical protein